MYFIESGEIKIMKIMDDVDVNLRTLAQVISLER